jgi:hypothetical protein
MLKPIGSSMMGMFNAQMFNESTGSSFLRDMQRAIQTISEEPYISYWIELGQFIHAFSDAEYRLLSLLRNHVGVSETIAGVLFSGTRQDAAKNLLNSILDATGKSDLKERLSLPLAQLTTIATIRNNLIHWIARDDGGEDLLVSNAFLSPSPEKLKEFRINADLIKKMRLDLYKITVLLTIIDSPSLPDPQLDAYLKQPWLYKPPQPHPRASGNPPQTPKQSRQRASSRKSRKL